MSVVIVRDGIKPEVWDKLMTRFGLAEFNPNHEPGGSSTGGQFMVGSGGPNAVQGGGRLAKAAPGDILRSEGSKSFAKVLKVREPEGYVDAAYCDKDGEFTGDEPSIDVSIRIQDGISDGVSGTDHSGTWELTGSSSYSGMPGFVRVKPMTKEERQRALDSGIPR